ncbi:hypothetical protein GXP67_15260 [Rhodocytophaga rosea]|uniref:Uncharacterized protein n=1 Tax=Rhodocytophaga rosea TaxID=2704465 RepID=A0A6C0GIY2_9BACT|nr:hypothetical protein [Rhodocytophaga rosea]QHT67899.1 hypothetical protein GXP67_15260 [Rhodocytophaga rosea]
MKKSQDIALEEKWEHLLDKLRQLVGKKPADLNAVLFLIGVQELGKGIRNFSKEQKQDLMHIAVCKLLSSLGIYEFEGLDEQGWPHWKLVKKLPHVDLLEQESLLKSLAIDYFEELDSI